MINLLTETEYALRIYHKTVDDIDWIGGKDFTVSLDNFFEIAKSVDYNPSYGCQEVATDLVIMFTDGSYLYRDEYDGAEEWAYVHIEKPAEERHIDFLCARQKGDSYYDFVGQQLYELNED